jgi:cell pole-organizing protein PopZ
LWRDTQVPAVLERIERSFGELAAAGAAADEKTMTEVARLLLRARARHWLVTERAEERASEEEVPDGSSD